MLLATDIIPLDTIKNHLRVDHDEEDDIIALYSEAAIAWCMWYCDSDALRNEADAKKIPAQIKSAMLLVIGDLFMRREANPVENCYKNPTVENLLWSCRDWRDTKENKEQDGGKNEYVGW